jgi:hypothetical protein
VSFGNSHHHISERRSRRVNRLEEKLDSLVSLLKPSQHVVGDSEKDTIATQPSEQPFPALLQNTPNSNASSRSLDQENLTTLSYKNTRSPQALLNLYRSDMEPQFPFVVIPSQVTAEKLASDRPFLYRTILMAACFHDKARRTEMAIGIFQYLSEHMIILNKKNFDFLQGLLVLMAWFV